MLIRKEELVQYRKDDKYELAEVLYYGSRFGYYDDDEADKDNDVSFMIESPWYYAATGAMYAGIMLMVFLLIYTGMGA